MKRVFGQALLLIFIPYSIFAITWFSNYTQEVKSVAYTGEQQPADITVVKGATVENSVLAEVNGYRVSSGLEPLTLNQTLCSSAAAKATDMALKDYFSHTSPEGHYFDYFISPDFTYITAAENLAMVNYDPLKSFEYWQGSPSHNSAMLGDFNATCIAINRLKPVEHDGQQVSPYVVVQHFAKL